MNTIITRLNDSGDSMLGWILWMNLWTLAILLVVILLDHALARRVEARWRVLLYAAIVLRLALPAMLETPVGVWSAAPPPPIAAGAVLGAPVLVHESGFDFDGDAVKFGAPSNGAADRPTVRIVAIAPVVWVSASLLLLGLWVASRRRLATRLAGALPARQSIARLAPGDRIVEHPHLGPAVAGVLRPVIVLPRDLAEESEQDMNALRTLHWIIRHESAHVSRRDQMVAAGMQMLTILCWPIIALWVAAHRVRRLMEQACDDRALAGASVAERRAYGETLLTMASRAPRAGRGGAAVLANIGLLGHAHAGLRGRLRALTNPVGRRWPAWVQIAGLVAALPVLVAGASVQAAPPRKAPAQITPANAPAELDITIRVFKSWPKHPKTTFDIAQRAGETPPTSEKPDPKAHVMSAEEYAAYLTLIQENPGAFLITSPRVRTSSGQSASIRVGQDDDQGAAKDGLVLEVTPVLRSDGALSLDAAYRAFGLPTQPPASNFGDGDEIHARLKGVELENGETIFALATGYIGAPMHLVAITVNVVSRGAGHAVQPPAPAAPDQPEGERFDPGDGVYPQIQFLAFARDLSVPPRLDQVVPDAARLDVKLTDAEAGFSTVTQVFMLSKEQERTLLDWLSRNSRETRMGNKNGVAITPPGQWSGLHVRPRRVDGRDQPGFSVRVLGRIEGEQVVLAAVYEEEIREAGVADPEKALALPTGARLVGRLTLSEGQACAIAIPATSRSPARVLVIRAEILRSVNDWPFQRATGLGVPQ
ncbi:MAG: hypothetical protein HRU76_05960 [Phycisphaeraceae bacterium]|nr:hypothetical protein [Phycisphaerales bacterium]QOJ17147.1 MAG: hypothetical protein HRU76_05960 [Phycisphaeraceae bacterium]